MRETLEEYFIENDPYRSSYQRLIIAMRITRVRRESEDIALIGTRNKYRGTVEKVKDYFGNITFRIRKLDNGFEVLSMK